MQNLRSRSLCLLALCAAGLLHAQQGGDATTIAGKVLDEAGKPIPAATVIVKNGAGAAAATTASDADGRFSATGLSAGTYNIDVSAPGFARNVVTGVQVPVVNAGDISIVLTIQTLAQSVTVTETVSVAVQEAPEGNTLDATAAKTEISGAFIHNFMTPTADFAEVVNLAPGTFSLSPNGIGLGQGKTFFRGFSDGEYTMTYDGIPFQDTNTPTHHSWVNFPGMWLGGTDFDRSPGQVSEFGPSNFGGSINLLSKEIQPDMDVRGTISYGSWDTRLLSLDFDSGRFGAGDKNSLFLNVHQMESDGYQTFNYQKRDAGQGKYQYRLSDRTSFYAYGSEVDIWTNTPNTTNPTSAQVAQFGDNFLLESNPGTPTAPNPLYYGYNYYHVQTDFEYAGITSDLGGGWRLDDKAYTTRYWNKQNYQNGATVSLTAAKPSGVDKLNGYRHAGDTLTVSKETKWGTFRTGTWYDWAYTDRYQIPENIVTRVDTPFGNFHEHYITETVQPFAEYEWHVAPKLVITAGVKDAAYKMDLNQYQDNGKTVGCLGGVLTSQPVTSIPFCVGGVQFVTHRITYNNVLPNLTARYRLQSHWSAYAQWAEGSQVPPSAVFDVTGGTVLSPPKSTVAKTYQVGSVLKFNRFTLDADAYYVHFQNGYDSYIDPTDNEPVYVATGPSNTKGVEAESSIAIMHGLSLYVNGSLGSAKYAGGPNYPNGGEWVANTPKNIEAATLLYQHANWDIGLIEKRVGTYYNDNATLTYNINGIKIPYPVDQAITINPFSLTNFFFNYTIKNASWLRGSKIGFSANNLFDSHNIVGITPFTAPTTTVAYAPNPGDQLNLLPGRSVMVTLTVGWAPRR